MDDAPPRRTRSGLYAAAPSDFPDEELTQLPAFTTGADVEAQLCRTVVDADSALAAFSGSSWLAWDMEWKFTRATNEEGRVALVQIANGKQCALIRLVNMEGLPQSLVRILTDPKTLKVGVNIIGDAKKLYKAFNVEAQSLFELSRGAWVVDRDFWRPGREPQHRIKLQHLVAYYLKRYLSKGEQASDWEAELSQAQIEYASKDAVASFRVFEELKGRGLAMAPPVDLISHKGCRVKCTEGLTERWEPAYRPVVPAISTSEERAKPGPRRRTLQAPRKRERTRLVKLTSNTDVADDGVGSNQAQVHGRAEASNPRKRSADVEGADRSTQKRARHE